MDTEAEIRAKAKALRDAGATPEQIKRYVDAAVGEMESAPADDTIEVNEDAGLKGFPQRFATTVLKGAQVIPGMKSLEAAFASGPVSHTLGQPDTPGVSYRDAKAGLEEQTARMGKTRGLLAEAVSSPMMAPIFAARGISGLSASAQGALYGGADQALDINPDETNTSRVLRTAVGAGAGGALAGSASGVMKLVKAPPGTVSKVLGSAAPKNLQRAARTWRTLNEAASAPIEKPEIRLYEASPPKTEGFIGNGIDNIGEALKAKATRPNLNDLFSAEAAAADVARASEEPGLIAGAVSGKPWKPRGRTKAQFDYFAEQLAKRKMP